MGAREANWARAEVVEIRCGLVKLFFVDMGEQGWVRQKNLRELPKIFCLCWCFALVLSMYVSPSPEGKPALQSHSL